jgi:hypothetical protein
MSYHTYDTQTHTHTHTQQQQQHVLMNLFLPMQHHRCGNVAAILQFDEKLHRNFLLFNEVPESEQSMPPRTTVPYFF